MVAPLLVRAPGRWCVCRREFGQTVFMPRTRTAPFVFAALVLGAVGLSAVLGVHGSALLGALALLALIAGPLLLSAR